MCTNRGWYLTHSFEPSTATRSNVGHWTGMNSCFTVHVVPHDLRGFTHPLSHRWGLDSQRWEITLHCTIPLPPRANDSHRRRYGAREDLPYAPSHGRIRDWDCPFLATDSGLNTWEIQYTRQVFCRIEPGVYSPPDGSEGEEPNYGKIELLFQTSMRRWFALRHSCKILRGKKVSVEMKRSWVQAMEQIFCSEHYPRKGHQ